MEIAKHKNGWIKVVAQRARTESHWDVFVEVQEEVVNVSHFDPSFTMEQAEAACKAIWQDVFMDEFRNRKSTAEERAEARAS